MVQSAAGGPIVGLALDRVVDPHNLGSLVRTAAFLGVSTVIVPAKESAPLSPVVSHVSAGALESVHIIQAGSFAPFLRSLSESGGLELLVSTLDPNSQDVIELARQRDPSPAVLVLGSEAKGVRGPVASIATHLVRLSAPAGVNEAVESLNVGVAGGIMLSHLQHSQ